MIGWNNNLQTTYKQMYWYWQNGQPLDNGKYVVDKPLGSGGYGITYRAKEQKTGKVFAIKTLNQKTQERADFEQIQIKFINEAIALATCIHPNIVRVYPQLFQEGKLCCMVMDYIEGPNLAEYVDEQGRLTETAALNLIIPISGALSLVHERGFIHRDVKPNNILLRQNDLTPVLIDFGLAREYSAGKLNSMTNARTEGYAPIEQYERHGEFEPYIDVYALAATLYTLVTGEIPLPANFRQHNIPLIPPQNHNPKISDRLNDAILKGMEFDYHNRPQSVSAWVSLLQPPQPVIITPDPVIQTPSPDPVIRRGVVSPPSPQSYTETLPGGVKLEMIRISAGRFWMGSTEEEVNRLCKEYNSEWPKDELPRHAVDVPEFYLGKYPITQAQWRAIMRNNPSTFKGDQNPVECVSWNNAIEFCKKLSQLTKKEYRLPSEAEWEYACRAGTQTRYCFGDDEKLLGDYAWYRSNSDSKTHPVGQKKPNQWGLYDMHGNVWEWCLDDYHKSYDNAPVDRSSWYDANKKNSSKAMRGGFWYSYPVSCRSAFRDYDARDIFDHSYGFRVAALVGRT